MLSRDQRRAYESFAKHLSSFKSAPFLFVGAGFARRYVQSPLWLALLETVAGPTGRPFGYFLTKGDSRNPAIASAIADELHDLWWNSPEFEDSRSAFGNQLKTREGPLKVEVSKLIATGGSQPLPRSGLAAREIRRLRASVIDGVITTN
jgi:hypothetical protein